MSNSERRKLLYNLLFNLISMFCVFWSIYVLIERATFEAKYGLLDWPFWTKMLVSKILFFNNFHNSIVHCKTSKDQRITSLMTINWPFLWTKITVKIFISNQSFDSFDISLIIDNVKVTETKILVKTFSHFWSSIYH